MFTINNKSLKNFTIKSKIKFKLMGKYWRFNK